MKLYVQCNQMAGIATARMCDKTIDEQWIIFSANQRLKSVPLRYLVLFNFKQVNAQRIL